MKHISVIFITLYLTAIFAQMFPRNSVNKKEEKWNKMLKPEKVKERTEGKNKDDTLVPEKVKEEGLFKAAYKKQHSSKLLDSGQSIDDLDESIFFLPYKSFTKNETASSDKDELRGSFYDKPLTIDLDSIASLPDVIDATPTKNIEGLGKMEDIIDATPRKSIEDNGKMPEATDAIPATNIEGVWKMEDIIDATPHKSIENMGKMPEATDAIPATNIEDMGKVGNIIDETPTKIIKDTGKMPETIDTIPAKNLEVMGGMPDIIDETPTKIIKDTGKMPEIIDTITAKSIEVMGKMPDIIDMTATEKVINEEVITKVDKEESKPSEEIKQDEIMKEPAFTPKEAAYIPHLDHAPTHEEEILLNQYKKESNLYYQYPPPLLKTRRHFDGQDGKIGSMSRFLAFMQDHNLHGGIKEKEEVCDKHFQRRSEVCDLDSKYRTMDGTCNNIKKHLVGASLMPYNRILPPDYGDKKYLPLPRGTSSYNKSSGYSSYLPSPRLISAKIMMDVKDPNKTENAKYSHLLMQWGQFLDHDITDTAKGAFDCCNPNIRIHRRCFPIVIPEDDYWFSQFGRTCLDFTRSSIHCTGEKNYPEQFSKNTAYMDASMIYGNDDTYCKVLRGGEERRRGQLIHNHENPHFLPDRKSLGANVDNLYYQYDDIVAGDHRAQGQATLISLHNIFFLEHNRIAKALYDAIRPNTKMDEFKLDAIIFQETRRLIVATIQQISYNEWLPKILGTSQMKAHSIHMDQNCSYVPTTEATILNEFSTAAMRFGHSMIQNTFRGKGQPWRLGAAFTEKFFAIKDGGHGYVNEMEGAAEQPCQTVDIHICDSMTQSLFVSTRNMTGDAKKTMKGKGSDIASINIQRGRDHGIRPYNDYRKHCGLQSIEDMNTAPGEISAEDWEKFRSAYSEPSQIDLFPGGLAETHVPGGIVGPTFACIIGMQLKNLMDGDRFFYRHDSGPNIKPLTGAALDSIKKRKLACLICENTDITELSMEAMIRPGGENPKIPCSKHPKLDLKGIIKDLLNQITM